MERDITPKQMAEKIVRMFSMSENITYYESRNYAKIAVDLILSAHPTKKISSTSIEYDYEFWNEVKNNI